MSAYLQCCKENKKALVFRLKRCIHNETMYESYFIESNVMCNGEAFYISNSLVSVAYKKRQAFKLVKLVCKETYRRMRLYKTDNSLGYTRLIYNLV